jgi:hypothetical protein
LVPGSSVADDAAVDVVMGEEDVDWFLLSGTDQLIDLAPGEVVTRLA